MCSEPVIRAPRSGCAAANSRAERHQAGHLVLGELDLLAAERGERQVGHLVVALGEGRGPGLGRRATERREGAGHESSCRTGLLRDRPHYAPRRRLRHTRCAAPLRQLHASPTSPATPTVRGTPPGAQRAGRWGMSGFRSAPRRPVHPPGLVPPRVTRTFVAITLRGYRVTLRIRHVSSKSGNFRFWPRQASTRSVRARRRRRQAAGTARRRRPHRRRRPMQRARRPAGANAARPALDRRPRRAASRHDDRRPTGAEHRRAARSTPAHRGRRPSRSSRTRCSAKSSHRHRPGDHARRDLAPAASTGSSSTSKRSTRSSSVDVDPLGGQPAAQHVVAGRHDLDAGAAQVGVQVAGRHPDRLARRQPHVVEQQRDQHARDRPGSARPAAGPVPARRRTPARGRATDRRDQRGPVRRRPGQQQVAPRRAGRRRRSAAPATTGSSAATSSASSDRRPTPPGRGSRRAPRTASSATSISGLW